MHALACQMHPEPKSYWGISTPMIEKSFDSQNNCEMSVAFQIWVENLSPTIKLYNEIVFEFLSPTTQDLFKVGFFNSKNLFFLPWTADLFSPNKLGAKDNNSEGHVFIFDKMPCFNEFSLIIYLRGKTQVGSTSEYKIQLYKQFPISTN